LGKIAGAVFHFRPIEMLEKQGRAADVMMYLSKASANIVLQWQNTGLHPWIRYRWFAVL